MNFHQELITQIALLRFRAQISYSEHQHTKEAFELTRAFIERGYLKIHREGGGTLHTHFEGEVLKGYVMVWRQSVTWYGAPVQYCALDFDWTDPGSVMWATQKLLEVRPLLGDDCELMLSARYASILGVVLSTGLGIDSVILLGDPKRSLQKLKEKYEPERQLHMLNLDIRPVRSRREVDHIIGLKRDYFTAHPEYCWFGAHEEHLKQHRHELERAVFMSKRGRTRLESARQRHRRASVTGQDNGLISGAEQSNVKDQERQSTQLWVIYRERTFLGNFSYTVQSANPLWGHSAGLEIMLHPLIQKKSVVKSVYRVMLESMIERGVEVYKGGTAQPAVMGLGKLMERPVFSWVLRKRAAFTPDHFSLYLPETQATVGLHGKH